MDRMEDFAFDGCMVTNITKNAFSGNHKITKLFLRSNSIDKIEETALDIPTISELFRELQLFYNINI